MHLVFSVQEEFNLRGAVTAAQALSPDIAIQLDLILATDTPDMTARGDVRLGGGPAMSLYSFHGRGTLERHHPASGAGPPLRRRRAAQEGLPLQRSAHIGALTDSSYVQLVNAGVAAIDLGFPARYTHSSLEVCDLADLVGADPAPRRRHRRDRRQASASTATTTRNEATISASTSAPSN